LLFRDDVQLPGVISVFKDAKGKIEKLKANNPDLFSSRKVFLNMMSLFESYSFKLTVRRELVKLFTNAAKLKNVASETSTCRVEDAHVVVP
jgi:hypothetical protein